MAANATLQTLGQIGAKPNFFLYDKVWRKATTPEDGTWLAHALEAYFSRDEEKIATDETIRAGFAAALIQLATEGASHKVRDLVAAFVRTANTHSPKLTHLALRDGMRTWLVQQEKAKATAKPVTAATAAATAPVRSRDVR